MDVLNIEYAQILDQKLAVNLVPIISHIHTETRKKYDSVYASLHAPYDDGTIARVHELARAKKLLNPAMLIVIGIGGSNLGALAVHHAMQGIFYNESQEAMKVYWADAPDQQYVAHICSQAQAALEAGKKILVTVISKSGSTTETIALFELFFDLLRIHHPQDYVQYCVAITDQGSRLWDFAHQKSMAMLAIPALVGGRYSIFSAAGLFPLAMLGIDIDSLAHGAQQAITQFFEQGTASDAAQLALTSYAAYRQGLLIHDFFVFGHNLQSLGLWLRQLIAESLGKTTVQEQKIQHVGIIPTVSVGTQDLHSMVQLYLAGPRTTFTTFIHQRRSAHGIALPTLPAFDALVPSLQGKSLAAIESAIFRGVLEAYQLADRPYATVLMQENSAHALGCYMQLKMIEVMLLGILLKVDPFDQPAVELYKKVTRKLLADG